MVILAERVIVTSCFVKRFYKISRPTGEDYLKEADCYQEPVLAVWKRCGKLNVAVDEPANLKLTKTADLFPVAEVLRPTEDAAVMEPDNYKIAEIASAKSLM